jgi:hypothetical protein
LALSISPERIDASVQDILRKFHSLQPYQQNEVLKEITRGSNIYLKGGRQHLDTSLGSPHITTRRKPSDAFEIEHWDFGSMPRTGKYEGYTYVKIYPTGRFLVGQDLRKIVRGKTVDRPFPHQIWITPDIRGDKHNWTFSEAILLAQKASLVQQAKNSEIREELKQAVKVKPE